MLRCRLQGSSIIKCISDFAGNVQQLSEAVVIEYWRRNAAST
jgi:hypothetical protein